MQASDALLPSALAQSSDDNGYAHSYILLELSRHIGVFVLGRHIGLHPTWNYLTFKQSCKSFNPKNHSSDNLHMLGIFTNHGQKHQKWQRDCFPALAGQAVPRNDELIDK